MPTSVHPMLRAGGSRNRLSRVTPVLAVTCLALGACGSDGDGASSTTRPGDSAQSGSPWDSANMDLSGTRAVTDSRIDSSNVENLEVAWTFEVPGGGLVGSLATTPLIVDGVVWVTDLDSNLYGVKLEDGSEVLTIRNNSSTFGPNGVAVGDGRVYFPPDSQSIAGYDSETGERLWRNQIIDTNGGAVNIHPVLADDILLVATTSMGRPGSRGTLFALDADSGDTKWSFDTIDSEDLWGNPEVNSGGGSWFPPAVDLATRRVYWGTANPYPWPGLPDFPLGSSRPGDNRWTDSTLSLDLDSGELIWGRQHRKHDLFDLDAVLTGIATMEDSSQVIVSSGKYGRVVGMAPDTGEVLWDTPIGIHENDELQSFEGSIQVYPGYLGGVTSPLAIADGVVFAAMVNAPTDLPEQKIDFEPDSPNFSLHNGQMVAVDAKNGEIVWDVEVEGQPFGGATVINDLVFGSTLTGEFFALDRYSGAERWSDQLANGVNGWPAVSGDTIVLPAGVMTGEDEGRLVAYRLP